MSEAHEIDMALLYELGPGAGHGDDAKRQSALPRIGGSKQEWNRGDAMASDLVCGMQVDERTAASRVFEGRSYFFCCAGCKKKFDASPFTYVGAPRHAGKAVHSGHARRYVRT